MNIHSAYETIRRCVQRYKQVQLVIDQLAASAGSCEAALEALEALARVCWADEDARQVAASDAGGLVSYHSCCCEGSQVHQICIHIMLHGRLGHAATCSSTSSHAWRASYRLVRGTYRVLPLLLMTLRTCSIATGVPAGVAAVLKAMRAWSFREDLTCQGCLALMVGRLNCSRNDFSCYRRRLLHPLCSVQGSDIALLPAGATARRRHIQIGARAQ